MNLKAIILTGALAVAVLFFGAVLFTEKYSRHLHGVSTAQNNEPAGSLNNGDSTLSNAGPVPGKVPWANSVGPPFPASASPEPGTVERTSENSVVIPPAVAPDKLTGRVPPGTDNFTTAQTPPGQVVVKQSAYPRTYTSRVTVREHYHSGKVHVGRAVKHAVVFSAKLPFKLRP